MHILEHRFPSRGPMGELLVMVEALVILALEVSLVVSVAVSLR